MVNQYLENNCYYYILIYYYIRFLKLPIQTCRKGIMTMLRNDFMFDEMYINNLNIEEGTSPEQSLNRTR